MHVPVKTWENFSSNQVVLDNQRNICLLKPEMFINVKQTEILGHISGAGGIQFVVHNIDIYKIAFQDMPAIVHMAIF